MFISKPLQLKRIYIARKMCWHFVLNYTHIKYKVFILMDFMTSYNQNVKNLKKKLLDRQNLSEKSELRCTSYGIIPLSSAIAL